MAPSPDVPTRFGDLSVAGQGRLLEMTYDRLVFGISVIPLVGAPFVLWFHQLGQDVRGLLAWTLAYGLAAFLIRLRSGTYRRDGRLGDARRLRKWLPRVHALALGHGLGLSTSVLLTAGRVPFEFVLLLYISLAAIMAANATHQSPVLSAFRRFFAAGWGTCTLLVPWAFPGHWQFVLPLSLLYSLSIYRHAGIAHRFFLQQIRLEEDSVRLAERYREAKDQAEKVLADKNQFLTTASHDLRQPVHAMGFLVESIASRNRDEALVPALTDLRRSVRSVTLMFNSLLDLSRIEADAVRVHMEAVLLAPVMDEVATLFRQEAQARQLELCVRARRGVAVRADAVLLRQSLVNLMHNALRYTRQGGVLLAARRRGSCWQIEVWDTGMGVALADQGRVFSPFFRQEHAWRIDSAGHGLGLAVVARCAELMGAEHGLSSREGKGSRFWLRLPAAVCGGESFGETAGAATRVQPPVYQPLCGRCLIVDDDPDVCGAWEALLASWNVEVRCVASGVGALALLQQGFIPGAIFCDQRLRAGENGFEVLQGLLARCPDTRGAMISGEFDSSELQRAEQEGYMVLRKPLQPEALYAVLSRWLLAREA